MKKNNLPSKKMGNLNFSKNNAKKMPLKRLSTLFYLVFYVCKSWKPQNTKVLFFQPIDLLKSFCVDVIIFLLFFFSSKSKITNLKVKKMFHTFVSNFQNPEVNKNPRKLRFQIVRLKHLNVLFSTLKTEKQRFLSIFDGRLNYFVI